MLEHMSPQVEEQIKESLKKGDIQTLKALFEQNTVNPKRQYTTTQGIRGNALHYFSYESGSFEQLPPYYMGGKPDLKISIEKTKEIVNFLVAKNVAVEGKEAEDNFFHQYPLATAIGFDSTHTALALIEAMKEKGKEAPLNAVTKGTFTGTPLTLAIQKGNKDVFYALLNTEMVNVNLPDENGLTPLHWAVIMAAPDMVEVLIKMGANIEATAKNGRKPQDYLSISKEDFEPERREVEFEGKKVSVVLANSTKLPEFRPIVAHFNNKEEEFLKAREENLKYGKHKIVAHLQKNALPVQPKKSLFFKNDKGKDKGKGSEELQERLMQEGNVELALELSRNVASQKEQLEKQVQKEKNMLQYDKEAKKINVPKLFGSIVSILQHVKLTEKQEKEAAKYEEEEGNDLRVTWLAEQIEKEYGYPSSIGKILVKRVVEADELSKEDIETIENLLHHETQVESDNKTKLKK